MRPHSQAEIRRQRHSLAASPPPSQSLPAPPFSVRSGLQKKQAAVSRIKEQNIYNPELHQQSRALQQQGKAREGRWDETSQGWSEPQAPVTFPHPTPLPPFWEDPCGVIRAAETQRLSIGLQGKFWGFRSSGPGVLSAFSLAGADTTEILWKQPNTPHSKLEACPAQGELHC